MNYRENYNRWLAQECVSEELKAEVTELKSRVEEVDFYPNMPGKERRSNYGTFYDFAPPQNPF